ncbi:hypothetical protein NBC2815_00134 [Xanthomonas fragariae]|nr:hypothetical protein NBC2815_00134 [Xanthomonas fragariae]
MAMIAAARWLIARKLRLRFFEAHEQPVYALRRGRSKARAPVACLPCRLAPRPRGRADQAAAGDDDVHGLGWFSVPASRRRPG